VSVTAAVTWTHLITRFKLPHTKVLAPFKQERVLLISFQNLICIATKMGYKFFFWFGLNENTAVPLVHTERVVLCCVVL